MSFAGSDSRSLVMLVLSLALSDLGSLLVSRPLVGLERPQNATHLSVSFAGSDSRSLVMLVLSLALSDLGTLLLSLHRSAQVISDHLSSELRCGLRHAWGGILGSSRYSSSRLAWHRRVRRAVAFGMHGRLPSCPVFFCFFCLFSTRMRPR